MIQPVSESDTDQIATLFASKKKMTEETKIEGKGLKYTARRALAPRENEAVVEEREEAATELKVLAITTSFTRVPFALSFS